VQAGGIRLVSRNFKWGKAIWLPKTPGGYPRAASDYHVDVDWTGEWVAWSMSMDEQSAGTFRKIAIKRLNDPLPIEPDLITFKGDFIAFTDNAQLLFVTENGLAILDRNGNVVRTTHVCDVYWGDGSWRRWGHR